MKKIHLENGQNTQGHFFAKEEIQRANKHKERYLIVLATKKIRTKCSDMRLSLQ